MVIFEAILHGDLARSKSFEEGFLMVHVAVASRKLRGIRGTEHLLNTSESLIVDDDSFLAIPESANMNYRSTVQRESCAYLPSIISVNSVELKVA